MIKRSILPPEMKGVMFVSGYRGKGKTFLAASADFPGNIAFFDFEDKGEGLHSQLGFGYYKALSQEKNDPLSRAEMFLAEVAKLEENKYTVAVIDNVSPLEKALQAVTYKDAKKYAETYGYQVGDILKDSFGKARGVANDLISDVVCRALHAKGIKLIIVTSHVKPAWNVLGKMNVQGRDRWQDLSILTLILVDGDKHPIPSAIVQKEQLASVTVLANSLTDKQLQAIMRGETASHTITRRLPYRIPVCDWQHIRRYLHNPADLDNPADGERLQPEEAEPFSERLSQEQIAYQLRTIEREAQAEREAEEASSILQAQAEEAVKDFVASLDGDLTPTKLAKVKAAIDSGELNYAGEITPALIKKWSE